MAPPDRGGGASDATREDCRGIPRRRRFRTHMASPVLWRRWPHKAFNLRFRGDRRHGKRRIRQPAPALPVARSYGPLAPCPQGPRLLLRRARAPAHAPRGPDRLRRRRRRRRRLPRPLLPPRVVALRARLGPRARVRARWRRHLQAAVLVGGVAVRDPGVAAPLL